jgi:hypothetical protein
VSIFFVNSCTFGGCDRSSSHDKCDVIVHLNLWEIQACYEPNTENMLKTAHNVIKGHNIRMFNNISLFNNYICIAPASGLSVDSTPSAAYPRVKYGTMFEREVRHPTLEDRSSAGLRADRLDVARLYNKLLA